MKQYVVQKYVMANSVAEALKKSRNYPIHEVYVHNAWFEKAMNFQFFETKNKKLGFDNPQFSHAKKKVV